MVRKLESTDFRATRCVLDASDFALGDDEPDAPPTDLIGEEAWHEIMDLPDDVAVRTTSHQGSRIAVMHELTGVWIKALYENSTGMVGHAMLDGYDHFQASTFAVVHGFYKEAIAPLRSTLETMTFAVSCQLTDDTKTWVGWLEGEELSFKRQCDRLQMASQIDRLEQAAKRLAGNGIFGVQRGSSRDAWVRNLYHRLSEYVHARGTNSSLWQSSGPIYSANGFSLAFRVFLETFALTFLLGKVAKPTLSPGPARYIFEESNRAIYLSPVNSLICGSYVEQLLEPAVGL